MILPGKSSKPPALPPAPAPLPQQDAAEVQAAEAAKRDEELRKRKGRQATILTSGLGDPNPASTERPALRQTLS